MHALTSKKCNLISKKQINKRKVENVRENKNELAGDSPLVLDLLLQQLLETVHFFLDALRKCSLGEPSVVASFADLELDKTLH